MYQQLYHYYTVRSIGETTDFILVESIAHLDFLSLNAAVEIEVLFV